MEVVASCTRDIGESSCSGRSASNSSFAVIQRPAKRKRSTPKESLSRRASSRATTDTLPDPDIADVNCSIWTNHLRTPHATAFGIRGESFTLAMPSLRDANTRDEFTRRIAESAASMPAGERGYGDSDIERLVESRVARHTAAPWPVLLRTINTLTHRHSCRGALACGVRLR